MRVLVTGSRDWPDGHAVRTALQECIEELEPDETLTIVHGGASRGPDQIADTWARWAWRRGLPVELPEVHLAEWLGPCRPECRRNHRREDARGRSVCPAAGFYRNDHMAALGADLCLAFIKAHSKGATHCANAAKAHGIDVIYHRA